MRIAVMGTGGVGGYFGARLAAAGEDVWFIARGAHLEAIRRDGLRLDSAAGDLQLPPGRATAQPEDVAPVDVVMFCVKLWDSDSAATALRPLLRDGTAVISFQNGVGADERLQRVLGPGYAVGGVAHIGAHIASPGVIHHTGTLARLTVGEYDRQVTTRVEAFVEAGRRAGFETVLSPDINRTIWEKFVFLAAFSGVTALARQAIGPLRGDADGRWFYAEAVAEAVAVARALGIDLPEDQVERVLTFTDTLPADMTSSMRGDLDRGARLELPWLSGEVVRLGRQTGVPTPLHRAILAVLKGMADGAPSAR